MQHRLTCLATLILDSNQRVALDVKLFNEGEVGGLWNRKWLFAVSPLEPHICMSNNHIWDYLNNIYIYIYIYVRLSNSPTEWCCIPGQENEEWANSEAIIQCTHLGTLTISRWQNYMPHGSPCGPESSILRKQYKRGNVTTKCSSSLLCSTQCLISEQSDDVLWCSSWLTSDNTSYWLICFQCLDFYFDFY